MYDYASKQKYAYFVDYASQQKYAYFVIKVVSSKIVLQSWFVGLPLSYPLKYVLSHSRKCSWVLFRHRQARVPMSSALFLFTPSTKGFCLFNCIAVEEVEEKQRIFILAVVVF